MAPHERRPRLLRHRREQGSLGKFVRRHPHVIGEKRAGKTELAHFLAIAQCGFEAGVMTSVRVERGVGQMRFLRGALPAAVGARITEFSGVHLQ